MSTNTPLPPAGWYPDPRGTGGERWWNGAAWSTETRATPSAPPAAYPGSAISDPSATSVSQPAPAQPMPPVQPAPSYPSQPPSPAQPDYSGQTGYPAQSSPYSSGPGYPTQPGYPGYQHGYAQGGYAAPPIGVWRSPADDRPAVAGMGGAIRTVFAKYARFEGRAGRPEFWWWALFNAIVIVGLYILIIAVAAGSWSGYRASGVMFSSFAGLLGILLWLWILGVVVPNLAVLVRRLRDAGYHWAFLFLNLVPFGSIALIVMCAQPSKYP